MTYITLKKNVFIKSIFVKTPYQAYVYNTSVTISVQVSARSGCCPFEMVSIRDCDFRVRVHLGNCPDIPQDIQYSTSTLYEEVKFYLDSDRSPILIFDCEQNPERIRIQCLWHRSGLGVCNFRLRIKGE